jgi:hypothetical protein
MALLGQGNGLGPDCTPLSITLGKSLDLTGVLILCISIPRKLSVRVCSKPFTFQLPSSQKRTNQNTEFSVLHLAFSLTPIISPSSGPLVGDVEYTSKCALARKGIFSAEMVVVQLA